MNAIEGVRGEFPNGAFEKRVNDGLTEDIEQMRERAKASVSKSQDDDEIYRPVRPRFGGERFDQVAKAQRRRHDRQTAQKQESETSRYPRPGNSADPPKKHKKTAEKRQRPIKIGL